MTRHHSPTYADRAQIVYIELIQNTYFATNAFITDIIFIFRFYVMLPLTSIDVTTFAPLKLDLRIKYKL